MPTFLKMIAPVLLWLITFFPCSGQTPINRVEYYIDADPGYGLGETVSITASTNVLASFSLNTGNIAQGMHIIGIRSRDANGVWSFDEQWLLFRSAPPAGAPVNITKAEWYIDLDPGYGNATAITPLAPGTGIANLSFAANLNTLSNGMHIIGVRSRDANGVWSFDEQWLLFKSAPPVITVNLKRVEYYIDSDPGYGLAFPLAFNASSAIDPLISSINTSGLDPGYHMLMVRSQDMNGAWSFDDSLGFIVNTSLASPLININSLAFTNACAAGPFTVGYHATGTFDIGNQFIAELSDATGGFSSPTQLGAPLTSMSPGGLINCTMPPNIQQGTGYRMRVRSTSPALISNESTLSISVDKSFLGNDTALVLLCAETGFDITQVYNIPNTGIVWSVANPTSAPLGIHTLYATNAIGCKDTTHLSVTQKIADWTGSISSDWHNPGNWSTGNIPDSETHVMVGVNVTPVNTCIISSNDAEVFSLLVKNGFVVQVNTNRKILINGKCQTP